MDVERTWGTDTVALGREAEREEARPRPRRRRLLRRKLPPFRPPALTLGALGLAIVVALLVALGGSDSHPDPIRKLDPARPTAEKPPVGMHRRGPHPASISRVGRKKAVRLKSKREPKVRAEPHEPDALAPAPGLIPEATPKQPLEVTPEPVPLPSPTPPAAEFGM
jgi:hypothetical protein